MTKGRPKQLACMCQQNLRENFPILADELLSVTGWRSVHCKLATSPAYSLFVGLVWVVVVWFCLFFLPQWDSAYLVNSA